MRGKCYHHIQPDDRLKIYESLFHGYSILEIAQETGFHRSTLHRELERKSRFIIAIKNSSRQAHTTANTLLNYKRANLHKTIKSLTLDNNPAFAGHKMISENIKSDIYFCEPYKSYQKRKIENANKLLRTQLPRQAKIDTLQQEVIDQIVKNLNDRPMKCLNYRTQNEVFYQAFRNYLI